MFVAECVYFVDRYDELTLLRPNKDIYDAGFNPI